MDQEDFEAQALMGERPIGGMPVIIPAASDSASRHDPFPIFNINADGRILPADEYLYLNISPSGNDKFFEFYNRARNDPAASDHALHGWEGGELEQDC